MKSRSIWSLLLAMFVASLLGLILTVVFNLLAFGRPDQALLQVIAEISRYSIDCENPKKSVLFNQTDLSGEYLSQLNWLLFDEHGQLLAARGSSRFNSEEQIHQLANNNLWQPIFLKSEFWIKQAELCDPALSLYVNDPNNKVFRSLLLKRQSSLFLLTSSCMTFVVFSIWWYLHRKGREATRVLRRFAGGDRQARMTLKPWEQSFELVHEFNRMADKVALLVEQIQQLDDERSRILAELAHDIRTPLASLLSGLETLGEFHHKLSAKQTERLLFNLNQDASYFRKLIDDLFLLAAIDSQARQQSFQRIALVPLIKQVWQSVWEGDHGLVLDVQLDEGKDALIWGDRNLLRRMFANLFENTRRYAQTQASLQLTKAGNDWHLTIINDSRPIKSSELDNWGQKRKQRLIRDDPANPHTSLGLGSSIACQIAKVHGGEAVLIYDAAHHPIWIEVQVKLPSLADKD
ncbi:MAG: sensor histidine kinase [Oligoflexus sp.]